MPGKVPPEELLSQVFTRTGTADPAVIQGPADGEDAAAIDVPAGTLVVSSDPISLSASRVGTLGVYVACNDVAVSGADPRWLTVVLMLPSGSSIEPIVEDLDAAARDVGASIVGGHSEYVDALDRPLVVLTAMGVGEFVPTGGAEPGQQVVLTKAAGIEGTAILASDFADRFGMDPEICDRAIGFFEEINVTPDARILREYATAMHDPTEGGVLAGLQELARASGVRIEIDRGAVPIRPETRALCADAGVDPLRIFGSGAVVGTVPDGEADAAIASLAAAGIDATAIGTVNDADVDEDTASGPTLVLDGEPIVDPIRDDLYPLWAAAESE